MQNVVNAYTRAYEDLLGKFNCPYPYFVKNMENRAWRVSGDDEMFFLSYEQEDGKPQTAVVVRQDGKPLVYRAGGYALVIAIDCVKIAFLLDEKREIAS